MKNAPDIKTTFQKNKGRLQNLRGKKGYRSQPHIHLPTFPLSTKPPPPPKDLWHVFMIIGKVWQFVSLVKSSSHFFRTVN